MGGGDGGWGARPRPHPVSTHDLSLKPQNRTNAAVKKRQLSLEASGVKGVKADNSALSERVDLQSGVYV